MGLISIFRSAITCKCTSDSALNAFVEMTERSLFPLSYDEKTLFYSFNFIILLIITSYIYLYQMKICDIICIIYFTRIKYKHVMPCMFSCSISFFAKETIAFIVTHFIVNNYSIVFFCIVPWNFIAGNLCLTLWMKREMH